jgi:hypothetical protein
MPKTAWVLILMGGSLAFGQVKNESRDAADKPDRATAYYHYALAHLYAEKAAVPGEHSQEYAAKANENYKAAIKADPEIFLLREEQAQGVPRRFRLPFVKPPAPRPSR